MCPRVPPHRPMRDLLEQLPRLPVTADNWVDFAATSPEELEKLADAAETTTRMLNAGTMAIGHLLAHSAVPVEAGDIAAPTLEAAGWLLAELADAAAACMALATGSRTALARTPRQSRLAQRRP